MFPIHKLTVISKGALLLYITIGLLFINKLNIALFKEDYLNEWFLLFFASALLIIQLTKVSATNTFNLLECIIVLLLFYILLQTHLVIGNNISLIAYLPFLVLLYVVLKLHISIFNFSTNTKLPLLFTLSMLFIYIAFSLLHCYYYKEPIGTLYHPNSSIFGMLIATQISFATPLFLQYRSKIYKNKIRSCIVALILIASLVLLIASNSRSAWLGFVAANIYMFYRFKNSVNKKVTWGIIVGVVLLFVTLLSYKSNSSNGRLLIYKISAMIFKDNLFSGIGMGQFKVRYNEYQAIYFALNNIDSKEALLADNTYYAFNDFFQFIIEIGVIGFIFLTLFLFQLFKQIKKRIITEEKKELFTAATAALICIVTCSFFSYPIQVIPITIQAIICLSIINSFTASHEIPFEFSKTGRKMAKSLLLSLSILMTLHFYFYFDFKIISNEAFELKRAGFKQKSFEKYAALSNSYIKDGYTLYLYAQELYYRNKLLKARQVLNIAKEYYCSNEVYKLSATIENELQNFDQAEKDYKTALYMVPNRMISRNNLLDFYMERKDTVKAIYWASSILNMPVKVPSKITENILRKTRKELLQLSK